MHKLTVRYAWEISESDPDIQALDDDGLPFIPDGVENAPVLKALEQLARMRSRKRVRSLAQTGGSECLL